MKTLLSVRSIKMFTMQVFVLILKIGICHSQELQWQKDYGGFEEDSPRAIELTSDGGFIVGGYSRSDVSGNKTASRKGGFDFWVIKFDSLGNELWQKSIGGTKADLLICIKETSDHGFIFGGHSISDSLRDKWEDNIGGNDYWIVKTDSIGNILWQNTIGGNNDDQLSDLKLTDDGGCILAGSSNSPISGDKVDSTFGLYDFWVIKLDVSGNIEWQRTIGGDKIDYLRSVDLTSDKGYILGGYSNSDISGLKTNNSIGEFDYWVVKIDSIGNLQWQKTIGGTKWDGLNTIISIDGGSYYALEGYSDSPISGNKSNDSKGVFDAWIVKLDSIGNVIWDRTIGGEKYDRSLKLIQTTDGGFLLGIYTTSPLSGDKTENNNIGYDVWILKLDESGLIMWQNTIWALSHDIIYDIKQTSDEGFLLGVKSASPNNFFTDKSEVNRGNYDYWIIKVAGKQNIINGKVYFDLNNNNVQDSSEYSLIGLKITEQGTSRISFTQDNGEYYVSVLDTGNYSVSTQTFDHFTSSPLNHSAYFNSLSQIDSLNDFAIQPLSSVNDLCVSISPLGNFRSGFTASYMITCKNVGTTILNPTIVFYPDPNVDFLQSSIPVSSTSPDSVTWSLPPMAPFQTVNIVVTVTVHLGIPIGTLINSFVKVEPIAGDANPGCNVAYWEVFTTGSFDPNDISVDKLNILSTTAMQPPYLEYVIRFQNTGNDTAFNVKIINPIDTNKVQLGTLEMVASSHPISSMVFTYHDRSLTFKFDNILLADSNISEPLSHGFVRYKVRTRPNLVVGDVIYNFAYIYFDFNEPIRTNNAITKVILPTEVEMNPVSTDAFYIYPTIVENELNVFMLSYNYSKDYVVSIYNMMGDVVYNRSIDKQEKTVKLNLSHLKSGVYLIEINKTRKKLIKM